MPNPTQAGSRLRASLAPAAWLYGAIIKTRNVFYDRGLLTTHHATIPIISVGNLTTGGTGKTPHVIEIAQRLSANGARPAVLTRGYRGTVQKPADEVLELRAALPDAPIIVNADRVSGARAAAAAGASCAILDDGFQHRRLFRDLDIVLIDALWPWGGESMLPLGRLREPRGGLRRADLAIITRTNQADAARIAEINDDIRGIAPKLSVITSAIEHTGIVDSTGARLDVSAIPQRMLVVAGLGNWRTVARTVHALVGESRIAGTREFPDHHDYYAADVARIIREAEYCGADAVLTTRKDWVKLHPLWPTSGSKDHVPLLRLDVRAVIDDRDGILDRALKNAMENRT